MNLQENPYNIIITTDDNGNNSRFDKHRSKKIATSSLFKPSVSLKKIIQGKDHKTEMKTQNI